MSFNIVDLVKDQLSDQLLGSMGNLLGDEGSKAGGAMDSMIPALLSGISGSAASPKGADALFGAVQDQDDGLLDNIGSLLSGGQASSLIDNGNNLLSSLLGGGGLGKLAGLLSAFSGVSKGGTSSLMGMVAPIILGVLKRKVLGDGLNAGSLASSLLGQKDNITAAFPSGFGDQLNASGFLSSLGDSASGAATAAAGAVAAGTAGAVSSVAGSVGDISGGIGDAVSGARDAAGDAVSGAVGSARDAAGNLAGNAGDAVSGAVGSARDAAGNIASGAGDAVSDAVGGARDAVGSAADGVADAAENGGSMFKWLLPLIVLAALAFAAYKFLLGGGTPDVNTEAVSDATSAVKDTATAAGTAASDAGAKVADVAKDAADKVAAVADLDPSAMGDELSSLFGGATETLSGITDAESATAALPALGELGDKVDGITGMMGKLPEEARGPVAKIASEGMGKLQPLIDKVMALPGVGAIVEPVLAPLMEKLQEFAG